MKTNFIKTLKSCTLLASLIIMSLLTFHSCSSEQALQKPLSFKDVENEFKFAKPLSEKSKQVILKQFGSIENYRDSIIQRKNAPNKKNTIVIGNPTLADSSDLRIFRMDKQALEKAGIKVFIDPKIKNSIQKKDTIISKVKSNIKTSANVIVEILDPLISHLYVISMDPDTYMLEQAETFGAELPSSCRAGTCATCCSRVISGYVYCPDQTFYDDDQLSRGFFPMCVAYPWSQCYVKGNQESELYCI